MIQPDGFRLRGVRVPNHRGRAPSFRISTKRLWVTLLAVLAFMSMGSTGLDAANPGSATEAVKRTVDRVLKILADEELKKPDRAEERQRRLEKVIGERFDYEEMGKRTLGKHWKKMTPAQREEFVRLFQQFLSNSYAGNVDSYAGEEVVYLKERNKGNFAEVQTKVVSAKVQVPLDYRLMKKNNDWWVYDVVIDGVGLTKNYRSQFSRIIQSSSYEGLLQRLRDKANQLQDSQ